MRIISAVKQMLAIVARLQKSHPKKRFSLDGRLVGDLGEILAEEKYQLTIYDKLVAHHDATTSRGKLVQIKTTMQNSLTFPADHVPHYYLGLKIHPDGRLEEIYNGPGSIIWKEIKHRKRPKNNLHSVSFTILERANRKVRASDRIKKRSPNKAMVPNFQRGAR